MQVLSSPKSASAKILFLLLENGFATSQELNNLVGRKFGSRLYELREKGCIVLFVKNDHNRLGVYMIMSIPSYIYINKFGNVADSREKLDFWDKVRNFFKL